MGPRVEEGIFIDYTYAFDQYLVFLPDKSKIIRATNTRFIGNEGGKSNLPGISQPGGVEQGFGEDSSGADEDSGKEDDSGRED